MIPKYRRSALIYLIGSVVSFVALVLVLRAFKGSGEWVIYRIAMAGGMVTFGLHLYGCYLLVKAKGQSSAILLFSAPLLCCGVGIGPLIVAIAAPDRHAKGGGRSRGWFGRLIEGRSHGSRLERQVRYKRNAFLMLYLGVPIMAAGVAVSFFRRGTFEEDSKVVGLGLLVVLVGYGLVIAGCRLWLKAKGWPSGVLLIGLAPLAAAFIPGVRILVTRQPAIIWCGMVFAAALLIVVILTLPDRSGRPR
jgi:hypothetical protein